MIRRALGKGWCWLWAGCAVLAACEADKAAPGVEFDPNLVEDDGGEDRPPIPPVGGGRADAGKDAAAQDAAPGASDAGAADGASFGEDAQLGDASSLPEPGALESAERLLIADGLEQRLYAYDVPSRRLLESFAVGAPARVYAGPSGRYGYALSSAGREVRIIDMGFVGEQSAQGSARRLAPVALLDASVSGVGPATLLAQSDWVALFFDGEARLEVLRESALEADDGGPLETQGFNLGALHHGFGLPFGESFLATRREAGGQVLLGRYDEFGTLDGSVSYACDAPEGAALAAGVLAVGCEAGILQLGPGSPSRLIRYPDDAGAQARARRLVGHPAEALHLTTVGDQVCVAGARSELSCQPFVQPTLDFGFDASGKRALVLGSDGMLRVFDAESLQPLGMLRVTSAVTSSDPLLQPQLASGRRLTYVSDPQTSSVHVIDPATLTLAGRLEIPGAPASLAVFGFRAAN